MSDFILPKKIESLIATLACLYEQKSQKNLQKILVNAKYRINEGFEHDNWDNGIDGHQVIFTLPEVLFFEIFDKIEKISKDLCIGLNQVNTAIKSEYFCDIIIEKEEVNYGDFRRKSGLQIDNSRIVSQTDQNRIWQENMFRVFLSHKTEDRKEVSELKKRLAPYGIDCFVAHEDIEPTKEWADEIENALFSMDACIAIMTENYHNSFWTDHEVGCAYGRHIPVIAVRMGLNPYGIIGKFQALSADWTSLHSSLMKYIIRNHRAKDAFIHAVNLCPSFDVGNSLAEIFPLIEKLSKAQVDDLITAWQNNSQAKDSFGFDGSRPRTYGLGIRYYIKKWDPERFPTKEAINTYCEKICSD